VRKELLLKLYVLQRLRRNDHGNVDVDGMQ
jgi:hypothetical protein